MTRKRISLSSRHFNRLSGDFSGRFSGITSWPAALAGLAAGSAILMVYCFKLASLVSQGPGETGSLMPILNFHSLLHNPLLSAYKLPAIVLQKMSLFSELASARLAAVIVALISIGLFYLLTQRWHGRLNAAGATVLFASSSWMLSVGRNAAGYGGLVLMVLVMLNAINWAKDTAHRGSAVVALAIAGGLCLFTPGGLWFAAAAAAVYAGTIKEVFAGSGRQARLAAIIIICLALLGLATACLNDHGLIRQVAGLPDKLPSWQTFGRQTLLGVSAFVVRGPDSPENWLGHTPLFDVASSALLILGGAFYARHNSTSRCRLLALFAVIGLLLTGLNGAAALSLLVPMAYLLLAAGQAYFIHQWKKVFPHNPVASVTAVMAVAILSAGVVTFQTVRYFIAWPQAAATIEARSADQPARRSYLIQ